MIKLTETITAISTAMSDSGIGIVRMSGPEAFEIADRIYKGKKQLSSQESHAIAFETGQSLISASKTARPLSDSRSVSPWGRRDSESVID